MTTLKHKLLCILTSCALIMPFTSCQDDLIYDPTDIGEGEAAINATLNFYEISNTLNSRAEAGDSEISGGTPGNAIGAINSICVLFYDLNGNLVRKYTRDELENYEYKPGGNTSTSPDAIKDGHQAETSTARATFSIGVTNKDNRVPFGKYHIYAVANMEDLSEYESEIQTEQGLKKIRLAWNADDIAGNNQMFGYFTTAADQKSEDFSAGELIVNQDILSVHAWIKRAVSKVTVAFNAQNLKENIWIYIKSVEIKDIPDSCFLGSENPGTPGDAGSKGHPIKFASQNQTIVYHDSIDKNYNTESWKQFISRGHPVYGANPDKATDSKLTFEQRIAAQHGEDVNALYFFENLQGKGVEGTPSDKRQQVNQKDKDDNVTSYPDGNNPDDVGWKDAKPYGTYIEVKAYYFSINAGDPGQGDITYRFMLGKDVKLDYNSMRNYHYKLTLCFNGYANDVDWHIEYDKEDRQIVVPNPYYISYLYNHSMMLPLDIDAGSATISSIKATIVSNNWAPMNASGGTATTPGDNGYALYWTPSDAPETYPYNGFLSLQPTDSTVITGSAPYYNNVNQAYYDRAQRGMITYTDFTPSTGTIEEALEDGEIHVALKQDDGKNHYTVNMPLWTRAKQLIKATAYTGNNPFVAYQREAKIKIEVTLSDGTILNTGLSTNGGVQSGELISIRQVRRIVNPKGIYRRADNNASFHVQLKRLPSEESTRFENFGSEGPWRAYIMRDTRRGESGGDWNDSNGTIRLTGPEGTTTGSISIKDKNGVSRSYQTIEGSTGSNIDFTVNFNGNTASDDEPNHAVIRVEYHNYTCYHLIFVRQGYGADDIIPGGDKWMACNNVSKGKIADSPLDEGSMFKFCNWDQPIASSNNKNNKSPWVNIVPNDFKNNAAGTLTLVGGGTAAWKDITSSSTSDNTAHFDEQSGMKVAEFANYKALYDNPDIEQGFGVLYGDDSSETLESINDAYGYMADEASKDKGMRGCFVYNYRTGKNLFFPIGASGYGHRKNSLSIGGSTYIGVLRYSCSGRSGYFPSDPLGADVTIKDPATGNNTTVKAYPQGVTGCPLFFDLFRRPGAIYWFERNTEDKIEPGKLVAWDFNYFSFDFFPISQANVYTATEPNIGSDACFVRSIKK